MFERRRANTARRRKYQFPNWKSARFECEHGVLEGLLFTDVAFPTGKATFLSHAPRLAFSPPRQELRRSKERCSEMSLFWLGNARLLKSGVHVEAVAFRKRWLSIENRQVVKRARAMKATLGRRRGARPAPNYTFSLALAELFSRECLRQSQGKGVVPAALGLARQKCVRHA